MMPLPKLYVRARWRFKDTELNCVRMYILLMPELRQLDIGTSMRRYAPPMGTAGLARCLVRGYRRGPAPPPRITAATDLELEMAVGDCDSSTDTPVALTVRDTAARGAELGALEEVLAAHGGAAARGRALREHGGGHVL